MNAPADMAHLATHADTGTLLPLPLARLRPGKYQPRTTFDEAELVELGASIKANGLAQPILARPVSPLEVNGQVTDYEIVCGERRCRGSALAGLTTIIALVRDLTDLEAQKIANIENLQRKDLHPMEEAEGFQRLMTEGGMTVDELVTSLNKSRAYIYAALKLCDLCPEVREMFAARKFDASVALLIARIPLPRVQQDAAAVVTNQDITYKRAKEILETRFTITLKKAPWQLNDGKLIEAAGSCTRCPKRVGNQQEMYPGVSADVCTDADCYAAKRAAHTAKTVEKAKTADQPVITGAEAEKIKPDSWSSELKNDWLDVDKEMSITGHGYLSPRGVLGSANLPPLTLLIDPKDPHKIIYICKRDKIYAAFAQHKDIEMTVPRGDPRTQAERDIMREIKLERAYRYKLFEEVRNAAGDDFPMHPEELSALVQLTWNYTDRMVIPLVMARWGWPKEWLEHGKRDNLEKAMIVLNDNQNIRLLLDLLLAGAANVTSWNMEKPPALLLAAAKRLKIDPKAVKTAAQTKAKKSKSKPDEVTK